MADEKAAFGVYPHLKAKRSKQDAEAAKNVPIDLARGAISGALGMPADIINLGGALASGLTGRDIPEVPFGSEYIEKRLPLRSDTPVSRAATTIGQLAGGADLGPLTKAAKGTAKAIAPKAADLLEQHMLNQGLMLPVVKPKGGNWIDSGLKIGLKDLKRSGSITPENIALAQKQADEVRQAGDEAYAQAIEQNILNAKRNNALNEWIDRNLTNYIKKEMGTPEDPVRKLAEQGISHIPEANLVNRYGDMMIRRQREKAGFPEQGMGESPMAKGWENISDALIQSQKPGEVRPLTKEANPWINKLDPNENIYGYDIHGSANFSHIMDVLRNDLASGRIRPDQLNKVSMEQAVRRTHEYDQEMARKMQEAKLRSFETMPVHKEYPEGYKWIELKAPNYNALPLEERKQMIAKLTEEAKQKGLSPEDYIQKYPETQLEEALKYEGDTMGHCVGGYCPDVLEGRSRIYSLRDKKGEPHVTVETSPGDFSSAFNNLTPDEQAAVRKAAGSWASDEDLLNAMKQVVPEKAAIPELIVQIKGKQNRAPKEEYLPFVQDFVKSGQWSDVGDLHNTGLFKVKEERPPGFQEWMRLRALGNEPKVPPGYYTPEELMQFGVESGLKEKYPSVYKQWRENLELPPEEGMKAGGAVHLTDNTDAMRMELDNKAMKDGGEMKATPAKRPEAVAAAEALNKLHQFASKPFGYSNPPAEMLSEFLGIPAVAKTLERIGYGEPLTTGSGMTTKPREETIEAAMSVAPMAKVTKGTPVGAMFIGPKAKTFNHEMADLAANLEKQGVDPVEIWKKTGTFRGADGIMRQEISDVNAIYRDPVQIGKLGDEKKAKAQELKERLITPIGQKDLWPKALTEAKKPVREEIKRLKEEADELRRHSHVYGQSSKFVLEHPELYQAYPDLAGIKVYQGQRGTMGELGSLRGGDTPNTMEFSVTSRGLAQHPRSTMLHEMQHAIQGIEGMSPGGNIAMAFQDPRAHEILKKLREDITRPSTFEEFQRANRFPPEKAQAAYDEYVKTYKAPISPSIELALQQQAAKEYYKRLAGEAEARATQYREGMGAAERKAEFPYASYDVLPEDLIVKNPKVGLSDNLDAMQMELDNNKLTGGMSQAAREARAKLKPLGEEFGAKAAEQARYKEAMAGVPLKDMKSFEEWRATQPQATPEELDAMRKEMGMAGGGLAEKLAKLLRAPAKSKAEIEAIAERMAPQVTGEFVRGEKGTQSVAGKTQKQFAREKEIQHDIRPTGAEPPAVPKLDYEKLKGNVMVGIAGDPTITGKSIHAVAGQPLQSPSPQHGGPLYGLGHDKDHFWASQLGAARRVQNLAKEAGEQYDAPVMGKYIMMGPESINYAQHYADANLSLIDPTKMRKSDIEGFNKLIRQGSPASGPRPSFPGIENPEEAYLFFSVDPESRKHFNALMQMPTVTERFNLPSGIDVRHAVTEPELRNLETGVTGFSVGKMRPDVPATGLKLSEHPTYSHDIPGEFMGQTAYPIPYELSFPDTLKAIRENPKQAPHEFGSLKMVGPRQIIDQQMIDEIKRYEETMKKLTGKKKGGTVTASGLIEVKRKKRK